MPTTQAIMYFIVSPCRRFAYTYLSNLDAMLVQTSFVVYH